MTRPRVIDWFVSGILAGWASSIGVILVLFMFGWLLATTYIALLLFALAWALIKEVSKE